MKKKTALPSLIKMVSKKSEKKENVDNMPIISAGNQPVIQITKQEAGIAEQDNKEDYVRSVALTYLGDPAVYALFLVIVFLLYTGDVGQLKVIAVLAIIYIASAVALCYLTISKMKELGFNQSLEKNQFIKAIDMKFTLLFIIFSLLFLGYNLLVLQKAILDFIPITLLLFAAAVPKNIYLVSQFLFLDKVSKLRKSGINAEKDITSMALANILIMDDNAMDNNLQLKFIYRDEKICKKEEADNEDKIFLYYENSYKNTSEAKGGVAESFFNNENKEIIIIRGELEKVLEKCDLIEEEGRIKQLSFGNKKEMLKKIKEFERPEFKIIGIAYKDKPDKKEYGFTFLTFVILGYSPRKEFLDIIRICKEAKIKILLISNKNTDFAAYIGTETGLISSANEPVIWDSNLTDEQILEKIKDTQLIANADEKTKKRITDLLKGRKIGVIDRLDNIEQILKESRSYFLNLANFVRYSITLGMLIFLLAFGSMLAPDMLPALQPTYILLLSFLFYLPSISLIFEKPFGGIIKNRLKLDKVYYETSVFLGFLIAIASVAIIAYTYNSIPLSGFFALFAVNAFNILNSNSLNRSFLSSIKTNPLAFASFILMIIFLVAFFYNPFIGQWFGVREISQNQFIFIISISLSIVIIEEIRKVLVKV